MPASNPTMIRRLQQAINQTFDERILYNKTQWYSESQKRPVTTYIIRRAVWDEDKHKTVNKELFKSTSQIQIVLFLRDLWYELNGWELPTDNDKWNKIREKTKAGENSICNTKSSKKKPAKS